MMLSSKSHLFLFSIILTISLSSNLLASQSKPRAFHIPIGKDTKTLQHYATIQLGTPPTNVDAVVDLSGHFLSLSCEKRVSSTTRRPVPCSSVACKTLANPKTLTCAKDKKTCAVKTSVFSGSLYEDVVTVHSTDGTAVYPDTYSARFAFACLDASAKDASNVLGLGRTASSLPSKLSAAYNIAPKFALCVPSSNEYGFGDLFIGGGPYMFPGGNDASRWLSITPLLRPETGEYLIGVKNIRVDKRINWSFDTSLDQAKISTATYHGVLGSLLYKAVVEDFSKRAAARNITRVAVVAPYGACFSTRNVRWTRAGPRVPEIDLELEGNMRNVNWRIHGGNSMVRVSEEVMCLGFVDGGAKAENAIVLGGLQMEDNFLEFDLSTSRLGFSSSLLTRDATCSHFRNL